MYAVRVWFVAIRKRYHIVSCRSYILAFYLPVLTVSYGAIFRNFIPRMPRYLIKTFHVFSCKDIRFIARLQSTWVLYLRRVNTAKWKYPSGYRAIPAMLSSQKTSEIGIVSNFLVLQISVQLFNSTNILQNKKSAPWNQSAEPQSIHQLPNLSLWASCRCCGAYR